MSPGTCVENAGVCFDEYPCVGRGRMGDGGIHQ